MPSNRYLLLAREVLRFPLPRSGLPSLQTKLESSLSIMVLIATVELWSVHTIVTLSVPRRFIRDRLKTSAAFAKAVARVGFIFGKLDNRVWVQIDVFITFRCMGSVDNSIYNYLLIRPTEPTQLPFHKR